MQFIQCHVKHVNLDFLERMANNETWQKWAGESHGPDLEKTIKGLVPKLIPFAYKLNSSENYQDLKRKVADLSDENLKNELLKVKLLLGKTETEASPGQTILQRVNALQQMQDQWEEMNSGLFKKPEVNAPAAKRSRASK